MKETDNLYAQDAQLVAGPGYLGTSFRVKGEMEFKVETDIPGRFSVFNSLCAIAICRHFEGVTEEILRSALKDIRVKGRVEMIKVSDDFILMIDYAHNAMALESLLSTLREYHPSRLVCMFGCGGNRARSRRYEMGETSGRMADFTIITSDNPRYEDPEAIMDDIETGIRRTNGRYTRISDRKEAIAYAIHNGKRGDIIVLAGKGHEDYQEINGKKYPMDERVLIREILEEDASRS
jgi:UDP-N-acetylmuramoyl-L-alanyl-D-glutamate--2,6-diaminopimelate ligase